MPKLSVLIPIYNVEPYLSQCLDSVVQQTLRDIEIICINDGSTDQSLAIIERYRKQDKRIILIDKPNSGYGDSMNQGLKKASGEYIGIVEPDDWIELDAFEKMYLLATQNQADVVKANYFTEKHNRTAEVKEIQRQEVIQHDLQSQSYRRVFKFAPAIWSAIYRRAFLLDNHIEFLPTPGASYQDVSFNFKVWILAEKIILTPDKFIHYRLDNTNSSVNNPGKVDCVRQEYREIEKFLASNNLLEAYGGIMAEARFRNYHWNLQRLSSALALNFYKDFRNEMLQLNHEGMIHRADFSRQHWLALQSMLKHPRFAYRALQIRSKLH